MWGGCQLTCCWQVYVPLGGVSLQSPEPPDGELAGDRLSPLPVLTLPPPFAEAVICAMSVTFDNTSNKGKAG